MLCAAELIRLLASDLLAQQVDRHHLAGLFKSAVK